MRDVHSLPNNTGAVSCLWLFKFKLIKVKLSSSSVALATFEVLSSHIPKMTVQLWDFLPLPLWRKVLLEALAQNHACTHQRLRMALQETEWPPQSFTIAQAPAANRELS